MKALLICLMLVAVALGCTTVQAEAGVSNISNQELSDLLKKGAKIIDIRTDSEWRQTGIIPDSHLLTLFDEDRNMINPEGWLSKVRSIASLDQPLILICRHGNRTIAATQLLVKSGYTAIYNVTRGIEPWIKLGLPIEPYK